MSAAARRLVQAAPGYAPGQSLLAHILWEHGAALAQGEDPLAPFGHRAAGDLLRVTGLDNSPDLYVHSTLDPNTDEVHAFEELVGCHGGLGGWQNRPILVHPHDWPVDEDLLDGGELYGAEAVHSQLVRWLERAGLRD